MRILIVDDHPLVREGLMMRIGLHSDLQVCGEAESEEEALGLVKEVSPDLVLIDISQERPWHRIDQTHQIAEFCR